MVSSEEVINYLKENLDKKDYISIFVAGSLPKKLIAGSDLDIFIVIKHSRKDNFLDNITNILNKFIKEHGEIIYSLFRGPIKYKDKGLIHIITYCDEKEIIFPDDEILPILKSFKKTAKTIAGKDVLSLIKEQNLKDKNRLKADKLKIEEKYNFFKGNGYIKYKEWQKTKTGWELQKTIKRPDSFYKGILESYYQKSLDIVSSN